ncbi:MAG: hypothetical protein M1281_17515 [Chloroflexi bacterium]|nr:hypothetical protein [Chloroflexota bacterium]
MKHFTRLAFFLIIIVAVVLANGALPVHAWTIPTFTITKVVTDQSVSIETANFPAGQVFTVTMGQIGTHGVNGIVVGTTDSGSGGTLSATYTIPTELKGQALIAIRLESPEGYFSYNWFANAPATPSSATQTPAPTTTLTPSPTTTPAASSTATIPTFSIQSVIRDQQVSIQTANFPPNQTFSVTMGKIGTRGVNGILVGSTESGQGGQFTAIYKIPAELAGLSQISIRLESPAGYFSYNWFYNNTTE